MTVLLNEALKWVGKLHDGPDVVRLAREIAQVFPDLSGYCAQVSPSTSWCGIFIAWLASKYKIRPPHGDDGVGGFMYVDAWAKVDWGGIRIEPGQEQPGDIICLSSPHHITILKAVEGERYRCVGGNQSDGVTETTFAKSGLMAIIRPPEAVAIGVNPGTGTTLRPLIKYGDVGATVSELQTLLGIEADGEFGPDTDAAVRAFQLAHGLLVDGEVGDDTWAALMSGGKPPPASDVPHAAEYADYWKRMTILPEHASELDTIARKLIGNKARYQAAVAGTKVPWFFVAVIHQRESSASFSHNIHNGQALGQVTTIAPTGRGPFDSFEASVTDWIRLKGLDKIVAWVIPRFAYQSEANNGMGYRNNGVPSAYLWSFSNIYRGGKYIHDGPTGWSPTTFDEQCGTMPMLKKMMALDASISFPLEGEVLPPFTVEPGDTDQTAPATDPLLLILLLLLSSKENPMADPAKPGQPDIAALLLQLLAQRLGSPIALPAPTPPPPPPPPPPPTDINAVLLALLQQSMTKAPAPVTTTPAITKPAVQVTGLASVVTILMQLAGVLPASIGETSTTAGILTTAVPLLLTALAPTGIFGTIFGGLLRGLTSLVPPK